jgi:hypothetical protein
MIDSKGNCGVGLSMKLADQGQCGCRARGSFPCERDRFPRPAPVCGRSVPVATGCVIITRSLALASAIAWALGLPGPVPAARFGGRPSPGQRAGVDSGL